MILSTFQDRLNANLLLHVKQRPTFAMQTAFILVSIFQKTIERQGFVSCSTAAEMQTKWKVQRAV